MRVGSRPAYRITGGSQNEADLHHFQTPVVDEPGQDLPLILGLRSMRSKDGVLEMAAGKERLTFPGPGGYSIQWMPGAQHFPLVPAPSGHLVLPCGEYQKIQQQGGLQRTATTFHATSPSGPAVPEAPSQGLSSTQ